MYICYLDESGNVERKGTTPYFVLSGGDTQDPSAAPQTGALRSATFAL